MGKQPPPVCPYCSDLASQAYGADVYPHRPDLASMRFWVCDPCDARVGCHTGTWRPYGVLANAATRLWRKKAHDCFDWVWQRGNVSRNAAYMRLSAFLEVDREDCHIGMFDDEQCKKVIQFGQQQRRLMGGQPWRGLS